MSKPLSTRRIIGYTFIALSVLILVFVAIAYYGWQSGQIARAREAEEALLATIERQIELAITNINDEDFAIAERRVEWLREHTQGNATVQALELTLGATPQPTATPAPPTTTPAPATATPTVTLTPTPLPEDPAERLGVLRELVEAEKWEDAIREITNFQVDYPTYEVREVNSLLFEAYVNEGFRLTNGDEIALGVSYYEKASALGALPEDAVSQLYFSRVYLKGIAYRGINWGVAILNFDEVCTFAPLFHDSCGLLYEAHVEYGDQWANSGEFCPAVEQYEFALAIESDNSVTQKLANTKPQCDRATVTPSAQGVWTPTPTP